MHKPSTDTELQKEKICEIQMQHDRELCSEPCLPKCHSIVCVCVWFKIYTGTYTDRCLLEYYKHSLKYL